MKKILFFLFILLLYGCFAIVEEDSSTKRVKSFIIPKREVLDILQRMEEQQPKEKYELHIYKSRSQD